MGIFSRDDEWAPQCRPVTRSQEGPVREWECYIKKEKHGKIVDIDPPVRIIKEDGQKPVISDTGGATVQDINRLVKWLNKSMV